VKADARHTPIEIGPTEAGDRLRIVWQDGAESIYSPRDLRMACPCAGCVDEMTGRRTLVDASVPEDVMPISIHYVGRYALQFVWSDGHQTGIYPYEYLRRLND
jgi:ATP-binding protein involved in chromosome partitioning